MSEFGCIEEVDICGRKVLDRMDRLEIQVGHVQTYDGDERRRDSPFLS